MGAAIPSARAKRDDCVEVEHRWRLRRRNYIYREGLGKGRPASTRLEFLGSVEEDGIAAEARIDPRLKETAHLRTEGALGSRFARDAIFLRAELLAPFRVRLDDLAVGGGIASFDKVQHVGPFQHHHFYHRRFYEADAGLPIVCNYNESTGLTFAAIPQRNFPKTEFLGSHTVSVLNDARELLTESPSESIGRIAPLFAVA
jgi:hypothetical protein